MPTVEKNAPPDRPPTAGPRAPDVFGIVGTTQCGSFHVERAVAEGGFAVVYRALHGAFRAPVALKCLKMPVSLSAQQRAEFLEKFRAEAELMFRLSASIAEVVRPLHVDHFIAPDGRFVPFIALEWLDGEPLSAVIDRRAAQNKPAVSLRRAVELLTPIARCLHRAHNFPGPEGPIAVVHCDVKPDNLFVIDQGGEAALKILDFGVAKARSLANSRAGGVTGSETNVFTPSYAAPEQWVPQKYGQTGPWTDVYAFSLSVLELILGRPPIEGEMHVMLAAAIDEHRRPTPRTLGIELPDRAERAFAAAVAVDPKRRIQTVEAFWTELERSLGLQPSLVRNNSFIGQRPVEIPEPPQRGRHDLESEAPPPDLELDLDLAQSSGAVPPPAPSRGGMAVPSPKRSSPGMPPPSARDAVDDAGAELDLGDVIEVSGSPPPRPAAPAPALDLALADARPAPPPRAQTAPALARIELENEPVRARRPDPLPGLEVDAMGRNAPSRLAPSVAARRAAGAEPYVVGGTSSVSHGLIPSWLYGPLFLVLVAAGITAADLYQVGATGQRLQVVDGIMAWWVAVGLFAGAAALGIASGLRRS